MKKIKRNNKVTICILILLIIVNIIIAYKLWGTGAKDIKASKQFMSELYSINAIDTDKDLSSIKYKRIDLVSSKNEQVQKTIMTDYFGIDLDKDNNIIGFAKKDINKNTTKIDLSEAEQKAESYLTELCDGEVWLKSVKNPEEGDSLPYYSLVYTTEKDGYPLYFDEINININKETGYIDGYSNLTVKRECKSPVLNITQAEAEISAMTEFIKNNTEAKIDEATSLVYAADKLEEKSNSVYELCYLITIRGINEDNLEIEWKFLVSTETGKVINIMKNGAEKEVRVN